MPGGALTLRRPAPPLPAGARVGCKVHDSYSACRHEYMALQSLHIGCALASLCASHQAFQPACSRMSWNRTTGPLHSVKTFPISPAIHHPLFQLVRCARPRPLLRATRARSWLCWVMVLWVLACLCGGRWTRRGGWRWVVLCFLILLLITYTVYNRIDLMCSWMRRGTWRWWQAVAALPCVLLC